MCNKSCPKGKNECCSKSRERFLVKREREKIEKEMEKLRLRLEVLDEKL